jgi:hypothetical protein
MAQYQVGGSVYEIPDNISQQDLDEVLRQLAEQEDQKQQQPQAQQPAAAAPIAPPQDRDNAFQYSFDQAQKLGGYAAQTIGNAIGNQGVADWGKDVVSQQDKDIAEGGYQSSLGDMSFLDAWEKGKTLDWIMTRGAENSATMVATPAVALTGFIASTLGAPVTAAVLGGGALATGVGLGIGSATSEAKEKGLDINDQSTAQKNIAIGAVVGLLDRIGAGSIVGKAIPKEKLLTMSTKEIAEVLAKQDKGMARRFLTAVLKSGGGEAATEGAQSATEMAGVALQGGEYTKEEVINKLVDEMALGGAGGVAMKAAAVPVQGAAGALSNKPALPEDAEAASSFAADIEARAEAEGYDLNDLDKTSNKGARQVIDDLHADYDEQMKMQRQILKDALNIKDSDPLLARIEKTLAKLAYREARNKTKSVVGKRELEAVGNLVDPMTGQRLADTKEGADLINLMRKTNELTKLHNKGYQGGVSAITDQLSPFGSKIGYDRGAIAAERVLRPILSGGAAISSGGLSLAGQLAAQGTGRVIDKLTGRRSNVAKYIRDNKKRDPLIGVDEPSVLEQQQAKEQQRQDNETARRQAAFAAGDMPAKDSPEAVMTIATEGVDRDTLMQLMETIKQQRPDLAQAADAWLASVRGDPVTDIEGLTELIRAAKSIVDSDPNLSALKNPQLAARLSENYTIPVGAAGISAAAPRDVSAGYVRGIQDNRETAKQLADAVRGDGNLSVRDRALLLQVLQEYQANLGVDPAGRAQSLYDSARSSMDDKAAADKYLMPYLQRVLGQQAAASTINTPTTNNMVPILGSGLPIFPKTKKLFKDLDGLDVDEGSYLSMPAKQDVTGNTYAGARVYINEKTGKPSMAVDPEQTEAPSKAFGKRWNSNALRPSRYSWVNNPTGHAGSIVAVDQGQQHVYALQYEADVPVELYRKPLKVDGTESQQPTMRPRGFGEIRLGKEIGTISVSGREHPIYDTIYIQPEMGNPTLNRMTTIDLMNNPPLIEGTGKRGVITVEDVGRFLEKESVAAGSKAPRTVRGGKETNSIDYTPELIDRLFEDILAEAREFYKTNPTAAYWYTFGSPEALNMMAEVIPELKEDGSNDPNKGLPLQMLFWTLISPLSGGQDPVANAKLAVDVLRYYVKNGRIPLSKYEDDALFIDPTKVRERTEQGQELAWTARGATTRNALAAIQNGIDAFGNLSTFMEWMTSPHPADEVVAMYQALGFGSEEASKNLPKYADKNGMIYGAQVLGPKFGPFLLNNTGNESKVTKDEWFTRSWNRLVGRMFTANGKEMLSQPASPEERVVQDEVITRVAEELGLEPAQMQALWWAYEQNLYTRLGVKSPTKDYIDAAKEVIKKVAGEAAAIDAERQTRARLGQQVAEAAARGLGSEPTTVSNKRRISPVGSRPAKPEEIRDQLSLVEPILGEGKPLDIGKQGSPLENGVQDPRVAQLIGEALGYTFEIFNSSADMERDQFEGHNVPPSNDETETEGALLSRDEPDSYIIDRRTGQRSKGKIYVRGDRPLNEKLFASLHEVGHGIERLPFKSKYKPQVSDAAYINQDGQVRISVNDAGRPDIYTETFRDYLLQIMQIASGVPYTKKEGQRSTVELSQADAKKVIDELVNLQRTGVLNVAGVDTSVRPDYDTMRSDIEYLRKANISKQEKQQRIDQLRQIIQDGEAKYIQKIPELAGDLLGAFLADPKGLKRQAPTAAYVAKTILNMASSPTSGILKFYSAPLATVVAAIIANMLVGEREDEDEKAALSLGRGALSA